MLKERDKIKGEKEELRKELTEMKRHYERIAEDSRSELVRIKYSYEHLETENRNIKTSHSEQQNVKLVHDKKVRELENQLQVYEQDRYNRMELVEYLQEEINRLEAERDKKNDETDLELDLLREKYHKA